MIVSKIFTPKFVKCIAVATPLIFANPVSNGQNKTLEKDEFVKTTQTMTKLEPVSKLYSPAIKVGNDVVYPAIVADISERKLYQYDMEGYLENVFSIAVGSEEKPTKAGLRVIRGIEKYPYTEAPTTTRRHDDPDRYGSYLLVLENIDLDTGEAVGYDGQFIHGTNTPYSVGKACSRGCLRMDNKDIESLAKNLMADQYVLFKE